MTQAAEPVAFPPPAGRPYVLLAMTVLAALLGCAAFPPFDLGALGWLALVPLLIVMGQVRPGEAFWHGWLFGTIFMGGNMAYVGKYGFLPWFALSAVMGVFFGLFGLVASQLRHSQPYQRVPALAAAWSLLELLRGHLGSLSLTFGDLAYTQHEQLGFIQFASLFGHYGVGFVMALLGAGIATVGLALLPQTWWRPGDLRRFNRDAGRLGLACFAVVFVIFVWGEAAVRLGSARERRVAEATGIRVAAVQAEGATLGREPRVTTQQTLDRYLAQSRLLDDTDLIVWPETALVEPLNLDLGARSELADLARNKVANLLVGAQEYSSGRIFNSAYFFGPDGKQAGVYRKLDLVMFGEYVPFRDKVPFFQRYPIRNFDYCAACRREVLHTARYSFAPLICFEGIFPEDSCQVARMGAELIVFITSDAWAVNTPELAQHSEVELFRSVEARKYLVRAATNGLSAVYDPYGTVLAEVPYYRNGSAVARIVPKPGLSVYHSLGDWPLLLLCAVSLLVGLWASVAGRAKGALHSVPEAPLPRSSDGSG